jgi:hypothetical protein
MRLTTKGISFPLMKFREVYSISIVVDLFHDIRRKITRTDHTQMLNFALSDLING